MNRKLIVFDFDGTLIDSQKHFDAMLIEFSEARGLQCDTVKMARGYVDPVNNDLGWNIPKERQPELFHEFARYGSEQLIEHKRFLPDFFPDAIDVLGELGLIYDLAIVTARDRETTRIILKHHGVYGHFPVYRTFCCARERGYAIKPAPDALECLLRETKHAPDDVIVVGDTTADIRMAAGAGVKSVAALWGLHPRDYFEAVNPTVMLGQIAELPRAVADLFGR